MLNDIRKRSKDEMKKIENNYSNDFARK